MTGMRYKAKVSFAEAMPKRSTTKRAMGLEHFIVRESLELCHVIYNLFVCEKRNDVSNAANVSLSAHRYGSS